MQQKYLKDVVTLKLNSNKCIGCGTCTRVCPHQILELKDNKVNIIDRDKCIECGACQKNCPTNAIQVEAGVGCADAVIRSLFSKGEPECGCGCGSSSEENNSNCC